MENRDPQKKKKLEKKRSSRERWKGRENTNSGDGKSKKRPKKAVSLGGGKRQVERARPSREPRECVRGRGYLGGCLVLFQSFRQTLRMASALGKPKAD